MTTRFNSLPGPLRLLSNCLCILLEFLWNTRSVSRSAASCPFASDSFAALQASLKSSCAQLLFELLYILIWMHYLLRKDKPSTALLPWYNRMYHKRTRSIAQQAYRDNLNLSFRRSESSHTSQAQRKCPQRNRNVGRILSGCHLHSEEVDRKELL